MGGRVGLPPRATTKNSKDDATRRGGRSTASTSALSMVTAQENVSTSAYKRGVGIKIVLTTHSTLDPHVRRGASERGHEGSNTNGPGTDASWGAVAAMASAPGGFLATMPLSPASTIPVPQAGGHATCITSCDVSGPFPSPLSLASGRPGGYQPPTARARPAIARGESFRRP